MVVDSIIFTGWVVFWLYWLMASVNVKAGRASWSRFRAIWAAIILVVFLLLRLRILKEQSVTHNPWLEGVGLAIFVLGLALAVWARVYIGRNWGMPMSQKLDPQLVTTGPYHLIRHPIYSGVILATVGTAIAASLFWLVVVALLSAYFIYSAVVEERYMTQEFPDDYPAYRRSTKMLIPFLV